MQQNLKVACIGSRETPSGVLKLMEKIGAELVKSGYIVASGNAIGADQAYARGGNTVSPEKVHLYLPWPTYEKQAILSKNVVVANPLSEWESLADKATSI